MTKRRKPEVRANRITKRRSDDLPPPTGLKAYRLTVGEDEIVILDFALPKFVLPLGLTRSEEEIVRSVCAGLSNAEIGRVRSTSTRTVANQLRSIFEKLAVSSRAELVYRSTQGR